MKTYLNQIREQCKCEFIGKTYEDKDVYLSDEVVVRKNNPDNTIYRKAIPVVIGYRNSGFPDNGWYEYNKLNQGGTLR